MSYPKAVHGSSTGLGGTPAASRWYLVTALAICVLVLSPLAPGLLLLWRADEFKVLTTIADDQTADETLLYGSAVHANELEHRLALLERRHPEIVAVGSSRMEQFRQPYFDATFVCLCTVMGALDDAEPLIDAMLERHVPKLVLLGLDFWWFNAAPQGRNVGVPRANPNAMTLQKALRPIEWWYRGDLTVSSAWTISSGGQVEVPHGDYGPIGLTARLRGRGVRADGSVLHGDTLASDSPVRPAQDLAVTMRRIADGHPLYQRDQQFDPARIAQLRAAIAKLEEAGVRVVTILPPMMGRIVDVLDADPGFAHIEAIRAALRDVGVLDYHDARPLGATDCEFVDDRHAGDIANMRVLLDIDRRVGLPPLSVARVSSAVRNQAGRAGANFEGFPQGPAERDFLMLGCDKANAA